MMGVYSKLVEQIKELHKNLLPEDKRVEKLQQENKLLTDKLATYDRTIDRLFRLLEVAKGGDKR